MQVQAFRKVNSYAFASTMCIGNLRSGMESLCAYFKTRNKDVLIKSMHYFGVILLFAFGAGIGGHLLPRLGMLHDLAVLPAPPRQLPSHVYQRRDRGASGNQTLSIRYPIPICVCI